MYTYMYSHVQVCLCYTSSFTPFTTQHILLIYVVLLISLTCILVLHTYVHRIHYVYHTSHIYNINIYNIHLYIAQSGWRLNDRRN